MKKVLPFAAAALMLAALITGALLLAGMEKKQDSSFDGASFVCSEGISVRRAAFFVREGGAA